MSRTVSQTINLSESASKYITKVNGGGISIHDLQRQNLDYIQLTSSGIDIKQNGISVASFGEVIRIGKESDSRLEIDYHSFKMIGRNETQPYVYISDLRNEYNKATITESFIGDGQKIRFWFDFLATNSSYSVTVNGVEASNVTKWISNVDFDSAPSEGDVIKVTYVTESSDLKVYTLGKREDGDKGPMSFVEGYKNIATGHSSHAEGRSTIANNSASHAEGHGTTASGNSSHAEGSDTTASGGSSHAEGLETTASGTGSHAEGLFTVASGTYSHAQNYMTVATESNQTVIGKYNKATVSGEPPSVIYSDVGNYAFIIGNGYDDTTEGRSNALTVDWNGQIIRNETEHLTAVNIRRWN